ncbi:MAG: glycosyl hydrolase family 8, partial [Candidatus Margulisiibacteriota bacterium]
MGILKLLIFGLFFLSITSQSGLLYKTSPYPIQGYGTRSPFWDNILSTTLAGYKARLIDPFSTGLVHDPSMVHLATLNEAVSEGSGYALLMNVWGNTPSGFDALWQAAQNREQKANKLFAWVNDVSGSVVATGSASDADEDIALALIFADTLKKRGFTGWSSSTQNYSSQAQQILNAIYTLEISSGNLRPDDAGSSDFNPSYFSPATYRIFAQFDNSSTHDWKAVVDNGYNVLSAQPGYSLGLAP